MEEIKDPANEPTTSERPLVTFALFTYNQEKYVGEAVKGALSQTYSPLEIIISDDGSSDGTFEVIQQMVGQYEGPHAIRLNRNSKNMGVNSHVNFVCTQLAKGGLIVVQAGDDISEPDRVSETVKAWRAHGPSAIYCNAMLIGSAGENIRQWRICSGADAEYVGSGVNTSKYTELKFYGAGAAYDSAVFKEFEPLPGHIRNEDYILAWRAAVTGGVLYLPRQLLNYRKHGDNLSFWAKMEGSQSIAKRLNIMRSAWLNVLVNREYVYEHILARRYSGMAVANGCYETILVDRIMLTLMGNKEVSGRMKAIEILKGASFGVWKKLTRRMVSLLLQIARLIFYQKT